MMDRMNKKMRIMNNRRLLLVLMVGLIIFGVGCRAKNHKRKPMIKYPYALKTVFSSPPAIVVSQTELVLANHRVFYPDGEQSRRMTNVDAYFEFRTALGNDYRIKVIGVSHTGDCF